VRIPGIAAASLTALNFPVEIQGPKKTGFFGSNVNYSKCFSLVARKKSTNDFLIFSLQLKPEKPRSLRARISPLGGEA
jgi:hypothetical protein